ncbi:MAG: zinc ABC transporter substrate-binding protein [Planctomycetota bacterium]|nr:MAG: zinc ABC transporter substrate-binding protein [Planctomycetota bacterium]
MFPRLRFQLSILILPGIVIGCTQSNLPISQTEKTNTGLPRIVVTSQPLLQMTQAIVGDAADVVLVVPGDTSSPDWSPTADDAGIMRQARLILISGAGYEPWKDRVSLPGSRTSDTAAGYYDQLIRIPDAVQHQHGPDGPHSHPGTVWATWLDPELCTAQLHQVSVNGGRLLPERKQSIETAEARLSAELNSLNVMIDAIKAAASDEALVVFSDAPHYQYLTRRLGWTLNYLHWDLTDTLSDANRQELLDTFSANSSDTLTQNNRRIFLLDSRHSADTEDFVRKSGGTVVRIDLCEAANSNSTSTSFPNRLKQNLERILQALEE